MSSSLFGGGLSDRDLIWLAVKLQTSAMLMPCECTFASAGIPLTL